MYERDVCAERDVTGVKLNDADLLDDELRVIEAVKDRGELRVIVGLFVFEENIVFVIMADTLDVTDDDREITGVNVI